MVIDTFSKTYAMTARIGYAPKPVVDKLSMFVQDSVSNVAASSRKPSTRRWRPTGLAGPQPADSSVKTGQKMAGLNSVPGIQCDVPAGWFYAFADITGTGLTSQEYTDG